MSNKAPSSFSAKLAIWMATRSSRNRTLVDRICRRMVNRAVAIAPEDDFMRDELIDNDLGFDADELDLYQRGQS